MMVGCTSWYFIMHLNEVLTPLKSKVYNVNILNVNYRCRACSVVTAMFLLVPTESHQRLQETYINNHRHTQLKSFKRHKRYTSQKISEANLNPVLQHIQSFQPLPPHYATSAFKLPDSSEAACLCQTVHRV